jgi:hypothetical protein
VSAKVTASYKWQDGDVVTVCVEVEVSYPDAIAEARATCIAALRDVTGIEERDG